MRFRAIALVVVLAGSVFMIASRSSEPRRADGDSRKDRFITYSLQEPNFDPTLLRVRVELATGVVIDQKSPDTSWDWGSFIVGSSDLNDDGVREAWIESGGNTAWNVSIAVFDDCQIKGVQQDDGGSKFLYSGSGNSMAGVESIGVECSDVNGDGLKEIVETETTRDLEVTAGWKVKEGWNWTAYGLRGTQATLLGRGRGDELNEKPMSLRWSHGLDCEDARW